MFSLLQRQKKLKRKNSRRTRKVCRCVVLLTEYLLGGKIKWLISIPRLLNCVFFQIYLLISYIFHHKYAKQNCFNFIKCLDTTVNFINFLLVFVSIYEYMLANNDAGFALLCVGYVSQATVIFSLQLRKRRTANLQVRLCGWLNENNYCFTKNFTCQLDYLYF